MIKGMDGVGFADKCPCAEFAALVCGVVVVDSSDWLYRRLRAGTTGKAPC